MATITIDDVPANELAARIGREAARFDPKARLRVTVEELNGAGEEGGDSLYALAQEITRKARERGLTDELLAEILAENDR